MSISIELLQERDFNRLFEFESQNRLFFESMVPSRRDDYYEFETFTIRNMALLDEQRQGISYFYLIKDHEGTILGRMNLVDIDEESVGHVGYRIGQTHTGKGFANAALKMLLKEAPRLRVLKIKAMTTIDNIASQKILEKNGFIKTAIKGDNENFVYYEISL